MKKLSLKNPVILFALLALQNGCNPSDTKKNNDAAYKQAIKLEKTGNFFWHENETDSALQCYGKSVAIYKSLGNNFTTSSDTVYAHRISTVYSHVGQIYINRNNLDTALQLAIESLQLSYIAHDGLADRERSNYNVALLYKTLGDEKGKGSAKCIALYTKGIRYAVSACWEADSAGAKSDFTLTTYYQAMDMYGVIGDSARESFYRAKYHALNDSLHPGK